MELRTVRIEKPEDVNFILGQSHFVKTVEDLHETLAQVGAAGISSGSRSARRRAPASSAARATTRTHRLAVANAEAIAAGHSFIVFLRGGFPVNVLNAVKSVPEVCRIFCATANPVEVVVAETEQGRAILGVVDGGSPLGVETRRTSPSARRSSGTSATSSEPVAAD